jgi:hypothetical protein
MCDETPVDAQKIMSEIEHRIWGEKEDHDALWMPNLDPELRAHLIHLREVASSLQMEPAVHIDTLPIAGRLLTWWRVRIHQLVLFYINNLSRQQMAFEQAVTRTIVCLAERYGAENLALRDEVEKLRQELIQSRNRADSEEK